MESSLRERLEAMARQSAEEMGYELYHLEMKTAGSRSVVRLYIEKEEGVTLDDCAAVSRRFGAMIEADDTVPGPYVLEVSSPGLDRPLFRASDYERFVGCRARVTTSRPIDGRRHFTGRIVSCRDGALRLALDGALEVELPLESLAAGRLEAEL